MTIRGRGKNMRKAISVLLAGSMLAFSLVGLSGCSSGDSSSSDSALEIDLNDWDAVVEAARGTTVTFYAWGGSDEMNAWMTGEVADTLMEKYEIDFQWVTVTNTSEAVTIVSDEKQAGVGAGEGTIDLVWIDVENFAMMKESDLLYGSIVDYIPNVTEYVDMTDELNYMDSGLATDGYEVPWDPVINVFIRDTATTDWAPTNADEFLEWCKEYEGFITYPSADDTYGRRMIWMFIDAVCGTDWADGLTEESTTEEIQAAIEPALEYMRELNQYLWNEGQTYPSSSNEWKTMFANGEVGLFFDWTPYSVGPSIEAGTLPETAEAFTFDYGTSAAMGFLSVTYNSPNVPGALVVINELLSPDLQFSMLENTGYPYAIDYDLLSDEDKARADAIDTGTGSLTTTEVAELNLNPTPASYLIEPINEIWWAEVAGQYND